MEKYRRRPGRKSAPLINRFKVKRCMAATEISSPGGKMGRKTVKLKCSHKSYYCDRAKSRLLYNNEI
jgi:hypothetical protein